MGKLRWRRALVEQQMNWPLLIVVAGVILGWLIWMRASQVPETVARGHIMAGAAVIDVRSSEEYRNGHLPGSVNIPLPELRKRLPDQFSSRGTVLLFHCLSGGRSALAVRQAKALGYEQAFNLGSFRRAERIVTPV